MICTTNPLEIRPSEIKVLPNCKLFILRVEFGSKQEVMKSREYVVRAKESKQIELFVNDWNTATNNQKSVLITMDQAASNYIAFGKWNDMDFFVSQGWSTHVTKRDQDFTLDIELTARLIH